MVILITSIEVLQIKSEFGIAIMTCRHICLNDTLWYRTWSWKKKSSEKNFIEIWLKNWNQFLWPSEAFTAKNYGQYIKEKVAKVNQIQIRIKKQTFKQQSNVTFQLLFKPHDGSLDLDVKFLWNFNLLLYAIILFLLVLQLA